jgi:hypothetical protein
MEDGRKEERKVKSATPAKSASSLCIIVDLKVRSVLFPLLPKKENCMDFKGGKKNSCLNFLERQRGRLIGLWVWMG